AAELIRRSRIAGKEAVGIAVEAIEAVGRSEPHETLVVLRDLSHARLRKLLGVFDAAECDVFAFDDRDHARLGRQPNRRRRLNVRTGCEAGRHEQREKRSQLELCVRHASEHQRASTNRRSRAVVSGFMKNDSAGTRWTDTPCPSSASATTGPTAATRVAASA